MKIKTVEFENFRNFKERNIIRCSTDGKVTIIYGNNGDGKTTLHQLFQWAFYNQVHFNATASDKMYNLEMESEQNFGSVFKVWATILFEHEGFDYLLRREWTYKKSIDDSKKIGEDFSISKKDDDYNWNRLPHPEAVIEQLLPSGLAEYFFFDGESMIADLRMKGHDSATKLRKALYSILDLDLLENAIAHIGSTELKTTVLGKLYLSKGSSSNNEEVDTLRHHIEAYEEKISQFEAQRDEARSELKSKKEFIREASEKIGSTKSKAEYEQTRKQHKARSAECLQLADRSLSLLGAEVIRSYPRLLMARAVEQAGNKLNINTQSGNSFAGISKALIESILASDHCLCGRSLGEEQYEHLRALLSDTTHSFHSEYAHFLKQAHTRLGDHYPSALREHLEDVLRNRREAEFEDQEVQRLDENERGSDIAIQELIDARSQAEYEIANAIEPLIGQITSQIDMHKVALRKLIKKYDELTKHLKSNLKAQERIQIMEEVKTALAERLQKASTEYSQRLCEEMQTLLNRMMTAERSVKVSRDFSMSVTDRFGDEAKSEGQFAVVSFAYIGGILKLLKSETALTSKEYPLVLDGPFSKLGLDHRKNVIDTIPEYAPQIIIFSKDNLQEDFGEERLGHVWTIQSNAEKNVACVKEGFLW